MKKFLALSLALAVMLLAGCQAKDFSLTDGRYIPEETGEDGIAVPYLLVRGNMLDVIQSVAVSYQPSGPMVRNGNEVVMETVFADIPCKWTFRLLDDNRLQFVSARSSLPYGEELWETGMIFVLAEE